MKEAASQYRFETASIFRDMAEQMTILKHGINGYHELITKNILLTIPYLQECQAASASCGQNGYKLFYVSGGFIRFKRKISTLSDRDIDTFIKESCRQACVPEGRDEKSSIDFRDILYSEIISLPEEMVRIL
jgi:excinuclease ABC subunit C